MNKVIWLAVVMVLVSCANTQINVPSFKAFVGLNWGTCCHYHHVVSVDVSGSMFGYQGGVNTMLSNWRNYLQAQEALSLKRCRQDL